MGFNFCNLCKKNKKKPGESQVKSMPFISHYKTHLISKACRIDFIHYFSQTIGGSMHPLTQCYSQLLHQRRRCTEGLWVLSSVTFWVQHGRKTEKVCDSFFFFKTLS